MATSRKRATPTAVTQTSIDHVQSVLLDLPEKDNGGFSMPEAMEQLYPVIRTTLEKGYSVEDISNLLSQEHLNVSAQSLKYYLSRIQKQQTSSRAKGKRTRNTKVKSVVVEDPKAASPSSDPVAIAPEATSTSETSKAEKPAARKRTTTAPKSPAKLAAKSKADQPATRSRTKK